MKRVLIIVTIIALMLTGCNSGNAKNNETEQEKLHVGVIQLVQHEALDDAYQGFVDGLAEAGYINGENIEIDLQNAQGEIANTNTIASKLVNDNNDLILAIATPAAQAVANATDKIPVLFTCVTDPVDAGLVETMERPGGNITGTADAAPIKEQIDLLVSFKPEIKSIGVLYCSNEANSHIQAGIAKEAIEALGLEYKEFTVSESNQIQQVVQTAVGQVDALYSCTDNMIAAAMAQVSTIATENGIPIVVGEKGQVGKGALATYGISYYELGRITATQAVEIFEGGNPAEMPVKTQTEFEMTVNEDTLNALGLEMPKDIK